MQPPFPSQPDWICLDSADDDIHLCDHLYSYGPDADSDSTDTPDDIDRTPTPTLNDDQSNAATAEDKGINMHSAWVPAAVLPDDDPSTPPWREDNWAYLVNTSIANDLAKYHMTPARDFHPWTWGQNESVLVADSCSNSPPEADELMVVDEETLEFLRSLAKGASHVYTLDVVRRLVRTPAVSGKKKFRNTIWQFLHTPSRD